MSNALIFIPDISGFTNFVNTTPVEHSRHIISELLGIIIEANELEMKVAEIEGDAVLFYREGPAPTFAELLDQTRKMFIDVHTHLKRYGSMRICNCEACSSASGLSLKFIAHFGEIGFIEVLNTTKPHGRALIVAHRILKNSIPSNQYLLVTKDLVDRNTTSEQLPEWISLPKEDFEEFDVGRVDYEYLLLDNLMADVPKAPLPLLPEWTLSPVVHEDTIPGDMEDVFEMITNLNKRPLWNPNLVFKDYDPEQINQAGMSHRCVIGKQEILVETTHLDWTKMELGMENLPNDDDHMRTFGERVTEVPVIGGLSVYYIMKREKEKTFLRLEAHFPKVSLLKRIPLFFIRRQFRNNLTLSLERLKELFLKQD